MMNERKLRIFYQLAKTNNMTLVAEALFVTQPAVSKAIKELEQELGVRLFDRVGKRLSLTDAGEVFLHYVQRLLNIYDESLDAIRDIHNLARGRLKIGASTTIGIYLLPDMIGGFVKLYNGIDVAITIDNTKMIVDKILDNSIDLAFVEGPVQQPEIVVNKFCLDRLAVIAPSDHRWAQKGVVPLAELACEKIIMRELGSGTREIFENVLRSHSVPYHTVIELGNTEAIKNAVAAGLGVSCISERCIAQEIKAGRLVSVAVEGVDICRDFYLIYHRDKYLTTLIKEFMGYAYARIRSI